MSSFDPNETLKTLELGEYAQLDSELDLARLEEILVRDLLPDLSDPQSRKQQALEANWQNRARLMDLVKPQSFNGRLIHPAVALELCQANALTSLETSRKASHFGDLSRYAGNIIAIKFTAELKSTKADITGHVIRPIWYTRNSSTSSTYRNRDILWIRFIGNDEGQSTLQDVLAKSRKMAGPNNGNNRSRTTRKL